MSDQPSFNPSLSRQTEVEHLRSRVRLVECVLQQLTARYGEMMKNPREWTPEGFRATERDIGSAKLFASDLRVKLLDSQT